MRALNKKMYKLFFPGKNRKDSKQNDVIILTGAKGVGKTTLAKYMLELYHKFNPEDRVFVFSGIKNAYDDIPFAKSIDLEEASRIEDEKPFNDWSGVPSADKFKNSIVLFDDYENYPHPKMNKILERLVNNIAQNGRNYSITLIAIMHHLNKGLKSSTLLRELDALIFFPEKFDSNVFNTLLNHFGLKKEFIIKLFNLPDKFVYLRNSYPFYYFTASNVNPKPIK